MLFRSAGLFGSHPSPSKDDYEMIMQVNYVSHFLLTLLLMEKLRKSAPSRIVNVSSMGSTRKNLNLQLNKDYFITLCSSSYQRYGESKLAQVLFTKELSQRLEGQGITISIIISITVVYHCISYELLINYVQNLEEWQKQFMSTSQSFLTCHYGVNIPICKKIKIATCF